MESELAVAVISSDDGFFHMISSDPAEIRRQPIASLIYSIPLTDEAEAAGVEAAAHELLAPDRRYGKWFSASDDRAVEAVSEAVRSVREAFGHSL
jgi:hypothetical protein